MRGFPPASQIYLYSKPTDMRKSFDGLCGLITGRLKENPMSGDIYIFINKPRNRIKLLRWESGGFVLFYKRLEKGTFELPDERNPGNSQRVTYSDLVMITTGISMKYARKRPRFSPQK